jgi:hypothetical protein
MGFLAGRVRSDTGGKRQVRGAWGSSVNAYLECLVLTERSVVLFGKGQFVQEKFYDGLSQRWDEGARARCRGMSENKKVENCPSMQVGWSVN